MPRRCVLAIVAAYAWASPALAGPRDACLAEGRKLADVRDYKRAASKLDACLADAPKDAVIESELSVALFMIKDYERAEHVARASIEHAADDAVKASSYFNLGRTLEEIGDVTGAIDAYKDSLKLRSNNAVAARLKPLEDKQKKTRADKPNDSKFMDYVRSWARDKQLVTQDWYLANLEDADAPATRVAILCPKDKSDTSYILIDRAAARWLITIPVDSRTVRRCDPAKAEPAFRQTALRYIEWVQGWRRGGVTIRLALRRGEPVVIWDSRISDARDNPDSVVKDFDALAKAGKDPHPKADGYEALYPLKVSRP
jgi:tetratricopeptide (TPR) repeat protein